MKHDVANRSFLGLVLAAVFALAGTAHGAIFNSHFDPLNFSGDGQFFIDSSCLSDDDGIHFGDGPSSPPCGAHLLSASVDIQDDSGSAHVDFAPVVSSAVIDAIDIEGGQLVAVETEWIGAAFADPGCTLGGALCTGPWWIRWYDDRFSDPVDLATGTCTAPDECQRGDTLATAFNVTFTQVPEPGTLALVGVGLLLAWRGSRRKIGKDGSAFGS